MKFATHSEAGNKGKNKDAFAIPPEDADQQAYGSCFAVADGISVCPKGGVVAEFAMQIVKDYYDLAVFHGAGEMSLDLSMEKLWEDFFVHIEKTGDYLLLESGATLTVVLIFNNCLHLRHLGDSCCDLFPSSGKEIRLTEEHISDDGSLINYFGGEYQTPCQNRTAVFPKDSRVILSSDGVGYFVETDTMKKIGDQLNWDTDDMLKEMLAISVQVGSLDDKTVVIGY